MARILYNTIVPKVEAIFDFKYKNKTKQVSIQEDQIVKISYLVGVELITETGRVNRIIFSRKPINPFSKKENSFSERYVITELELDCSKVNKSIITRIPVASIIEIHDSEIDEDFEQANSMKVKANLIANISVTLSDGISSNRELREGDGVSGLVYDSYLSQSLNLPLDREISGTIGSIKYVVKGYSTNAQSETLKISECVDIGIIEIKTNSKEHTNTVCVDPRHIKYLGKKQYTISDMTKIEETIALMEDGEILRIPCGEVPKSIYIDRSIYLLGACAGISVDDEKRLKIPLTTFKDKIKFKEGVDVYLDGFVFTNHGVLDFENSKNITITNCTFTKLFPEVRRGSMIRLSNSEECVMTVSHCCFESWERYSEDRIDSIDYAMEYNIEVTGPLKNSCFSDNYFVKGCCKSDNIAIFGISNDSSVYIYRNIFEFSGNAIWIGVKDNPTCHVYIENNTYIFTTDDDRAGLVRVQPYLYYTKSFENMTIILNGNKKPNPDAQILYVYYDEYSDTKITQSKVPTIFLNGVRIMKPVPETVMKIVE